MQRFTSLHSLCSGETDGRPVVLREKIVFPTGLVFYALFQKFRTICPLLVYFKLNCCCSSFLAYTPNRPVALSLLLLHPPGTLPADIRLCENILTFKCHLNPSIQTHLVLLCCVKRLCIFEPKGAIQIRYYHYLTFFNLPRPAATATAATAATATA